MTADIEKEAQTTEEDASQKKDDIFDLVGGDGLWQRCIFLVVLFLAIPSATHNLAMSFLAPNLDHWCSRPERSNWTVEEWREIAMPADDKHCSRYKSFNVSSPFDENFTITRSEEVISCDSWEYDTSFYISTVLSEWDLVCDKEWLVSLSKSVFVAGTFVANILFGHLADTMGRRPTITACSAIAVFSAVTCAFSTSFVMFIVTRFFLSVGISGVYNIGFVLMMEVIGISQRSMYGIAFNFGWAIGFVSLPAIAWFLRDWFWIQIVLTAPCIILLVTWWMLPESPRWLMTKGRTEEAHATLLKAAKTNGKETAEVDTKLKKIMSKVTEVHETGDNGGSFIDLFRTAGLWQMTLIIYILWFVNSFVYYGLSYNTNELAGDPFINFALCGAVEMPAYVITPFVIGRVGRKYPLAGVMIIGGISCLLMYPLPTEPAWISTTVSMVGKFCITCSFAIVYLFTAEVFPTVVRNIGLGSASVWARVGSILAPFVRELGHATHPVVPQIVFGALAFVAGLLVFLLPETNNIKVPETIADAVSRSRQRETKSQNGHVTVKLSNGDHVNAKEVISDEELGVVPSPKPQQNGKKLDDVPEEDPHSEIIETAEDTSRNDRSSEGTCTAEEEASKSNEQTSTLEVPTPNSAVPTQNPEVPTPNSTVPTPPDVSVVIETPDSTPVIDDGDQRTPL